MWFCLERGLSATASCECLGPSVCVGNKNLAMYEIYRPLHLPYVIFADFIIEFQDFLEEKLCSS